MKFLREKVHSPVKEDDNIMIVSSTASRRRTTSSATVLEKKKAALGLGGDPDESMEPSTAVDLEELERKAEERKRSRKGKRASDVKRSGSVAERRKGVVISEPRSSGKGDKFVIDDVAESGEEGDNQRLRERAKGKLKVNDTSNRINNRRIARDVEEVSTDGIDFCGEEHEARWNPTLINKHYEFRDEGATEATLKLGDIIEELTGKHPTVLKKEDGLGEDVKPLTISDKLMKGKHVIDVEFNVADQPELGLEGEATELEAKIHALKSRVPLAVNAFAANHEPVPTISANPTNDAEAEDADSVATSDETSTSHV
ncbi:hypothetical protein LIER_06976 [Lithospermum erythrorhizon]|uniref:Uncharacterized protein n=1 Tax=Lithospermum erythrorhizon TaxID=34254 RepID=A0AAV3P7R6_LITER